MKEKDTCPVCGLWYNLQLDTCSNRECEAHHSYDRVPPAIRKAAVYANANRITSKPNSNQFTIFLPGNREGDYIGGLSETEYTIDQVVPTIRGVGVVVQPTN